MPAIARLGDPIGGPGHGGAITQGSSDVVVNGKPAARLGDQAVCSAHGPQTIVGGSGSVNVNSKKLARVGDAISCGAKIVAGSGDSVAG